MAEDLFSSYLEYASGNEVPVFFHRWSIVTGLGAYLGRQYYFQHGHSVINPNLYSMLIGSPGTRKSTAIKLVKKLLRAANYHTFSAEKTSKEKFLEDLAMEHEGRNDAQIDTFLDESLFGDSQGDSTSGFSPAQCFIAPDEANDFFGISNLEFLSLLGTLWDWNEPNAFYHYRTKTKKSIEIFQPTISILAGNTPTGFTTAFPTEIIGQGFFSRLLLIYGEPNGKRIAFPEIPDPDRVTDLVRRLAEIRQVANGPAKIDRNAKRLFELIYNTDPIFDDSRFESYKTRRFTQLLKLALIYSAARSSTEITERDIIHANTLLTYTERLMPKALGEFGKAKHSDVSHRILEYIQSAAPVTLRMIYKQVHKDVDKLADVNTLLQTLVLAEKIQMVSMQGQDVFLPKLRTLGSEDNEFVDYGIFTDEERNVKI